MLFRPEKGTFKKSKKSNFSKGVSPWSLSKNRAFYHLSIFAIQAREDRFLTFWIKKLCFLDQKKEVLKMTKKLKFSKGVSPQFLSKNQTFYHLCFLDKSSHKKSFLKKSCRKRMLFETRKRKFSESLTNGSFSKGLVRGFGQKIELFYVCVFGKLSKKKSFFDILTKKECFWDQKN